MNWKEIISDAAPNIGSAILNPMGFMTEKAMKMVSKALTGKVSSSTKEISKIVSDISIDELSTKLQQYEMEIQKILLEVKKIDLEKIKSENEDRQNARATLISMQQSGDQRMSRMIYYLAGFIIVSCMLFFITASLASVFFPDEKLHLIRETILILESLVLSVVGFFFGSNYSRNKQQ